MKDCPKIIQLHCENKDKSCETCFKFSEFIDKGKRKEGEENVNGKRKTNS